MTDGSFSHFERLVNFMIHSLVIWKLEISSRKKNGILGHFRLSEGYTYLRFPIENRVFRSFWGVSSIFLWSTSCKICILGKLGTFGFNYGPKNWFRPPFSLITKSILKIDLLRIPKQLLPRGFQKLDDYPPLPSHFLNWSNADQGKSSRNTESNTVKKSCR